MKEIGIKLALDGAAKVQSELKGVEAGLGRLGSSVKAVAANAGSFAASLGLGISLGKLVQVQREFDVLNASLTTVTGSGAAAAREMAWLKDFAKETPFGLAQATQGFVKMKALGLDPTRSALTSFGNTASAMGKDLNQMIEAVADASTGEFERLKEFGIKAKKEGDNVSLTFQGVTTTIKNSASEITKYLEDIGNVQFGGAMAERAKTLDGAISELGDTWDELFRTINERNAGTLIYDSVKLANGAIEDATTIIKAMTAAYDENGQATGAMATIQNGIATVFETVAVLGANLKYVLVQIGTEIGGLAAQVAQAAQFNFSGVAAIREQMVADAEEARRQIDATTARILGARKAQEEYARWSTRNASAATDPRRIDLGRPAASGKPTGPTDSDIKAANKALQDQAKLLAELSGLSGSFAQDWANLNALYAARKLTTEQLAAAQAALLEKQPAIKAAADEEKKAQELLAKSYQDAAAERMKIVTAMEQSAASAADQNQTLRDEIELIGLTEEQQTRVLQQRNEAIILTKEATLAELERASAITGTMTREQIALAAEIEALKERNELLGAKSVKNTAAEAAKKAEDEWKKTTDQINESLTDALMRGFESGKDFAKNMRDTVVNMFKTMVLRPVISAVMSPVAGAINGAVGSAVGSVGSSILTSMGGSVIGNTVMGGLGSVGGFIGTAYNTALGTSLGLGSSSAAAAAQAASMAGGAGATSASLGATLGAAVPYLAAAGALYSIISSFDDSGTHHSGAGAIYKDGQLREGKDLYGSLVFNMGHRDEYNANSQATVSGIASAVGGALDTFATAFGEKAGYEVATAFADDSSDDGAWGSLRISKDGQELLNWRNTQTSRWAPKEFGDGEEGYKQYLAAVAKDTRQVLLDMDLPGWADNILQAIGDSPSLESLSAALAQIGQAQTVFKSFGQYMTTFATLADSSVTKLAAASGGIGALAGNMGVFVDQFYTDAEKLAVNTENVREAMGKLGFELPATRDEFKALVQAQLALGDAGAETAAALLGLSGAFAAVTESTQALTQSLDDYISKTARSSTEAARIRGLAAVGNSAALARLGVPGYASGGYHPGGLRLVGENGPELEVTGPSQIISSPMTADLLRGGSADTARLEALVEKLTAEVANLRAETRAVVTHTATTARILKRVTPEGDALQTREVAAV